jgi:predicted GIY-YIG superfamily endonuclease
VNPPSQPSIRARKRAGPHPNRITARLGARLRTHARGSTKGGQQLKRFELIHREEFQDHAAARKREKFLKSGQGRAWLDEHFPWKSPETTVDTAGASPTVSDSSIGV